MSGDLGLLLEIGGEADGAALRRRRVHQLADCREDGADGELGAGLELLDVCGAVLHLCYPGHARINPCSLPRGASGHPQC